MSKKMPLVGVRIENIMVYRKVASIVAWAGLIKPNIVDYRLMLGKRYNRLPNLRIYFAISRAISSRILTKFFSRRSDGGMESKRCPASVKYLFFSAGLASAAPSSVRA